ncbi:unnamed protein product, partial [Dovyalis caffra]
VLFWEYSFKTDGKIGNDPNVFILILTKTFKVKLWDKFAQSSKADKAAIET